MPRSTAGGFQALFAQTLNGKPDQMYSRRALLLSALAGVLMLFSAGGAQAANEQEAKAFVERLGQDALDTMTVKGMTDQERAARFRQLFTASVDMPEIARFVLGRYWRTASTEQQQEFLKLFEEMVVLTWAGRFKDYGGDVVHQVTNVSPDGERGVFVESVVKREKQEPIGLQWRLRQPDGAFKVVDLIVGGSSMAITYRAEYASVVQNNGGKIDGLLAAMRKKIAELQPQSGSITAGAAAKAN
jgi:phospholipid transport system substrate-binding protein